MRKYTSQSVVTRKRSRLTSAQSFVTGLYSVRYSPLLLLTLGIIVKVPTVQAKHKSLSPYYPQHIVITCDLLL